MKKQVIKCSKTKNEVYHALYTRAHEGTYISYLRGKRCSTEELFFYEVSASFQFPDYFGENWAAFDECICDLEWLDFTKIFIIVDDFEAMFAGNKETQDLLIKYFENVVTYWESMSIPVEIWLNFSQL